MSADPLTDPRAADLLAAQPDEVIAVASRLRAAAGESEQVTVGLTAAQHDATWSGLAADAFRRAIARLIPTLGQVEGGFVRVAAALTAYEAELASIRPQFLGVVAELGAGVPRPSVADLVFLRQRAFLLLDEFAAAREACRAAISEQRDATPPPRLAGNGTTVVG